MKISKQKTMFTRFITAMISALMLTIVFSFSAVSVMAMAADVNETAETAVIEEIPAGETENTEISDVQFNSLENMAFEVNTLKDSNESNFAMLAAGGSSGSGSGSADADSTFQNVINFFITWFRRVGALVAFVGAIMFALAIKQNDAEQKQAGIITMVAGFVVVAICLAADMFDLFS